MKVADNGQVIMPLGNAHLEATTLAAENKRERRKLQRLARASKLPQWYRGRPVILPDGQRGRFLHFSQHQSKGEFAHCLNEAGRKVCIGGSRLRADNP